MMMLELRNFDEELRPDANLPVGEVMPEKTFTETEVQGMLEEIRDHAFEEGRRKGEEAATVAMANTQERQLADTFAALLPQLSDLSQAAESRRAAMEHAIVDLVLGVGERLVPELLQVHAPDLVAARVRSGVHMARGETGLTVRVAATLAPRIEAMLAKGGEPLANGMTITVEAADDLPVGAARLVWKDGYLDYDLEQACNAALRELREAASLMAEEMERT